jgi:hypothetical protein
VAADDDRLGDVIGRVLDVSPPDGVTN